MRRKINKQKCTSYMQAKQYKRDSQVACNVKNQQKLAQVTCKKKMLKKFTSCEQSERSPKRHTQVNMQPNTKSIYKLCAKWKVNKDMQVTCKQKMQKKSQVVCKVKNQQKGTRKLPNKFKKHAQVVCSALCAYWRAQTGLLARTD